MSTGVSGDCDDHSQETLGEKNRRVYVEIQLSHNKGILTAMREEVGRVTGTDFTPIMDDGVVVKSCINITAQAALYYKDADEFRRLSAACQELKVIGPEILELKDLAHKYHGITIAGDGRLKVRI